MKFTTVLPLSILKCVTCLTIHSVFTIPLVKLHLVKVQYVRALHCKTWGEMEECNKKTEGQERRDCFWAEARNKAESGHSQLYPSPCLCLSASTSTKRALFWTVQRDQRYRVVGKKERGQWARQS